MTVRPTVGTLAGMSILSGVLSGGGLLLSALGAALDPSHHPFKRSLVRPGGPMKKRDAEVAEWECEYMKPTASHTRQKCRNIHNPDRKPKIVKISKGYKKKYNKLYRAGKFPKARRFKKDVRDPRAAYKPTRSRTYAKVGGSKRKSKR